jgi:hypothetical protein
MGGFDAASLARAIQHASGINGERPN